MSRLVPLLLVKAVVVDTNKDISSFRNFTATNITANQGTLDDLVVEDDITINSGDLKIASHNGSNGLKLGETLVTASAAELNTLKAVTAGTVAPGKAVVVDTNKDISSFGNITATEFSGDLTGDVTGNVYTTDVAANVLLY